MPGDDGLSYEALRPCSGRQLPKVPGTSGASDATGGLINSRQYVLLHLRSCCRAEVGEMTPYCRVIALGKVQEESKTG